MPRLPTLQGQITHLSQREKSDRDHGRTTCEVRERPKNEASVGKSPKESCPICSTRAAAVRLLREESGAFVTARETWLTSARSVWRHSFTLCTNYDVEYASRNVLYAFFYWYGIFPILLLFFFGYRTSNQKKSTDPLSVRSSVHHLVACFLASISVIESVNEQTFRSRDLLIIFAQAFFLKNAEEKRIIIFKRYFTTNIILMEIMVLWKNIPRI